MTIEEIRSMTPGPEMDAAVAQHVMGWVRDERWNCLCPPNYPAPDAMWSPWKNDSEGPYRSPTNRVDGLATNVDGRPFVPDYSQCDETALQLVDFLHYKGLRHLSDSGFGDDKYLHGFTSKTGPLIPGNCEFVGLGETEAVAICRAALLALAAAGTKEAPCNPAK